MPRLLHIIATPRGKESRTLRISESFLQRFREEFPDGTIDEIDLFRERLPQMRGGPVEGKYALMGNEHMTEETSRAWAGVESHIRRFLSADIYLVSTPMWNFSLPYVLKHYIDVIVQPGYLFRYGEKGPEGLAEDKRMIVVSARGGDYGPASPARSMDMLEPYLREVFGFVGIWNITFVNAQPMDAAGPEVAQKRIKECIERLKTVPMMEKMPV